MQYQLQGLRFKHQIQIMELSAILKISKNLYLKKEKGEEEFTLYEMYLLSKFYQLPVSKLFVKSEKHKY